jgi:hypothetical protein
MHPHRRLPAASPGEVPAPPGAGRGPDLLAEHAREVALVERSQVCFTHPRLTDQEAHDRLARRLRLDQIAWISRVTLAGHTCALRACITSYETQLEDVEALAQALEDALPPPP